MIVASFLVSFCLVLVAAPGAQAQSAGSSNPPDGYSCWNDPIKMPGPVPPDYAPSIDNKNWTDNWVQQADIEFPQEALNVSFFRWADVNVDGMDDLLWFSPDSTTNVSILLNPGTGIDAMRQKTSDPANYIKTKMPLDTSCVQCIFVKDVDGDSLPDLLVLDPATGAINVTLVANPFVANFSDSYLPKGPPYQAFQVPPGTDFSNVKFTDMIGHGHASLVLYMNGTILRWLGWDGPLSNECPINSTGPFDDSGYFSRPDPLLNDFADIDGDGRDDYVTWWHAESFNSSNGVIDRYMNTGFSGSLNPHSQNISNEHSNFSASQDFRANFGADQGPFLGSFARLNHIERLDALLNNGSKSWKVWRNDGRHTWSGPSLNPVFLPSWVDMNGDHIDDLIYSGVVSDFTLDTVCSFFLNDGASVSNLTFRQQNCTIPQMSFQHSSKHFADMNGDHYADIVIIDIYHLNMSIYLNDKNFGFASEPIEIPTLQLTQTFGYFFDQNIRLADLNGDGLADVLFMDPSGSVLPFYNVYDRTTSTQGTIDFTGNPAACATGQLTLDPKMGRENAEVIRVPELEGSPVKFTDVDFADVNGDGKADYVWRSPHKSQFFVFTTSISNDTSRPRFDLNRTLTSPATWALPKRSQFARVTRTSGMDLVQLTDAGFIGYENKCPPPIENLLFSSNSSKRNLGLRNVLPKTTK